MRQLTFCSLAALLFACGSSNRGGGTTATPTAQWESSSQEVTEGTTVMLRLVLGAPAMSEVSVPFALSGSAAAGGVDFDLPASPLVVAEGSSEATLSLVAHADGMDEGDEEVVLTLGIPTGAALGERSTLTVTVHDGDATPVVRWVEASQSAQESAGLAIAAFEIDRPSASPIDVAISLSGTATVAQDYQEPSLSVRIPAGEAVGSVLVAILDNQTPQADRQLVLTLASATNALVGEPANHTLDIVDDDQSFWMLPRVSWTTASRVLAEDDGPLLLELTLDRFWTDELTLFIVESGTAVGGGEDYMLSSSVVTIPAGELSAITTFTVVQDDLDEPIEAVTLTLVPPSDVVLGSLGEQTVALIDDDPAPTIGFEMPETEIWEGDDPITLRVVLEGRSSRELTLGLSTQGTAVSGVDFTPLPAQLTVAAGASDVTFPFNVLDNSNTEADRALALSLSVPEGALPGMTDLVLTVHDDDPKPVVECVSAASPVSEADGHWDLVVTLDRPTARDVQMRLQLDPSSTARGDGVDLTLPDGGVLVILAGTQSDSLRVLLDDDAIYEGDETAVFTFVTVNGAEVGVPATCQLTIADDEQMPTLQFTTSEERVSESTGNVSVNATLDRASASAVNFAVEADASSTATGGGDDYALGPMPLTIPAGSRFASAVVSITQDECYEKEETIVLKLTGVSGANTEPATHTIRIADDEALPRVNFSAPVTVEADEKGGTVTATVSLSPISSEDVLVPFTVAGSATLTADYALDQTSPLLIQAGDDEAVIDVTVLDDLLAEQMETVILALGGAPANAVRGDLPEFTLTITDDDPLVSWSQAIQRVPEKDAPTVTVTAQLDHAALVDIEVEFAVSGTAAPGSDYTPPDSTIYVHAGDLEGSTTFQVLSDAIHEIPDENVVLTLTRTSLGKLGTQKVQTITLIDGPPYVWYVNAAATLPVDGHDWDHAFRHPQDALDVAQAGDEIWVAAGTYVRREPTDTQVMQLVSNVPIYGSFTTASTLRTERDVDANPTVLDGEHAVLVVDAVVSSTLDSFKIIRGQRSGSNTYGGGVAVGQVGQLEDNVTISNCRFVDNHATWGAGVSCYRSKNLKVLDSVFEANKADVGSATDGGGIYMYAECTGEVRRCRFIGNTAVTTGGGLAVGGLASVTVERCGFFGNRAGWGGGMHTGSSTTINNSVFSGNQAGAGGGALHQENSGISVNLVQCTVYGNTGIGIYVRNGNLTVTSSILWGNAGGTFNLAFPYPGGSYSDIDWDMSWSWFTDLGNNIFQTDPLFVDANGADNIQGTADDDLSLESDSPCIDTGYCMYAKDYTGKTRPGTGCDMGAYEK